MTRTLDLMEQARGARPGDPPPPPPPELVRAVRAQVFAHDEEYRRLSHLRPSGFGGGLVDYVFATAADPHLPHEVFDRLRWGGQYVFVTPDAREVVELSAKFRDRRGFVIEREPAVVHKRFLGMRLPFLGTSAYYFAARKVALVQPGQMTDRFTYDVRLVRRPGGGYAVLKQIPDFDQVVNRLHDRLPDTPMDVIVRGARKLVDKVFPVFLTRETAFLSILNRDLPAMFGGRVPRVIEAQKDSQGFVRRLYLEWLRNGCEPLTQLEFARQSAELLRVVHEQAGIIHLDLRLDNFVITPRGVGFVDFGSAVRVGENLNQNPMLRTLFAEMMTTSQIQRDLGKMVRKGKVTSRLLVNSHQKVDKGVDLFYLALQINDPHSNPEFENLVTVDRASPEAAQLAKLTREILEPRDPENPPYQSAADVVDALERIKGK